MDEDLDIFLADFGVPCQAGATSFKGLFDQPDQMLNLQRASPLSREYMLTYRTSAVALKRDTEVTVNGQAFKTREAPHQLGDGAFSTVLLSRT